MARPRFAGTRAHGERGHLHARFESKLERGLTKPSISFLALGCLSGTLKIQRIVRMDPSAFLYSIFPVWRAGMER